MRHTCLSARILPPSFFFSLYACSDPNNVVILAYSFNFPLRVKQLARRKRVEGSSFVPKSLLYSKPGIHSGCDRFRMAIVQQKKEIVVLEHVWVQSLRYQRSFTCILQMIVILHNVLKWPERRPEPGSSIKVKERMHGPGNIDVLFIVCFLLLIQV